MSLIHSQIIDPHDVFKWKIDDLGNGLCTILNEGSNKYLSASNRTAHWQPILVAAESGPGPAVPVNEAWIIQPTSDFTYS